VELYRYAPNTHSWRGAQLNHRDEFTFTLLVPRVKWPGREADHSRPSTAEVKNAWRYTSTLVTCLHGVVLNLAKDTSLCHGA